MQGEVNHLLSGVLSEIQTRQLPMGTYFDKVFLDLGIFYDPCDIDRRDRWLQ